MFFSHERYVIEEDITNFLLLNIEKYVGYSKVARGPKKAII